jgi:hypothetical protein
MGEKKKKKTVTYSLTDGGMDTYNMVGFLGTKSLAGLMYNTID